MKKIIAIVLAIVMMAAMSVVVFADVDTDTQAASNFETAGPVGGMNVTYSTSKTYTVTVPADVELIAGVETTRNIYITDYMLEANETLSIKATSANGEDGKWELAEVDALTGATNVEYTVAADGDEKASGDVVIKATPDDTAAGAEDIKAVLTFNTEGTSQVANFADVITFTAVIEGTYVAG